MNKIKHKKLIIIILIILLSLIGFISYKSFHKNKSNGKKPDNYKISKDKVEIPGTIRYTNNDLQSSHCVDKICIDGVVFYYIGDTGRIDYYISNYSLKEASGYLKLKFGDKILYAIYKNLGSGKTIKSTSQFMEVNITNKENYELEKISEKEFSNIVKKKK